MNSQESVFGRKLLSNFLLESDYTNLNHGSFGTMPKIVREAFRNYQNKMEANPDKWFRYHLKPLYSEGVARLAEYINANKEDVVFVENASVAVNAVLRSLDFKQGDKILYFNIAYGMVKSTLAFMKDYAKVDLVQVVLKFPTTYAEILETVRQEIVKHSTPNGNSIKIAVFDHITSTPAVILPAKELVSLFRDHGILSLIDGAHAVGQIPLDLKDIDADFYASNAHKWLFAPKAVAFLCTRKEMQSKIHPLMISHGYKKGYDEEFFWVGTRDYSSILCVKDALDFRKTFGESNIMDHNHRLALWTGQYLANLWNTDTLIPSEQADQMIASMVNVRLPSSTDQFSHEMGEKFVKTILDNHQIFLVVFPFQGHLYARISCQIYTEENDIKVLGNAVLKILESGDFVANPMNERNAFEDMTKKTS